MSNLTEKQLHEVGRFKRNLHERINTYSLWYQIPREDLIKAMLEEFSDELSETS